MKYLNQLFLFSICVLGSFSINAQQSSKVDGALSGFMKTEFMLKFQDIKTEAEGMATAFKSEQNKYSAQDRTRVSTAYDKTVRRFNAVLIDIKNDFLDKDKIKVISKYPEMYGDGLRADMRDLTDYYAQNFQQALADVTNNEVDGSPIILLLIELVKLSSEGINGLVQMRKNAKKYDEQYLTQHLVRPSQFKYWNELGNDSYNNDTYNDNTYNDTYNDPYNDTFNDTNNNDTYNNDTFENTNNDTYNDTYNNDTYNNTNNETLDNNYNGNNNLNQNNNNNNTQYDDIENYKFEKKETTQPANNQSNNTTKRKIISSPTRGNGKVIKPKTKKEFAPSY